MYGIYIFVLMISANTCAATEVDNSDHSPTGSISGTTGEVITVTCDTGYGYGGDATCGTDGHFSMPTCERTCDIVYLLVFLYYISLVAISNKQSCHIMMPCHICIYSLVQHDRGQL